MENFDPEKEIQKAQKWLKIAQDRKEQIRNFLYPHELAEYDILAQKSRSGDISQKEKEQYLFFSFLGGGLEQRAGSAICLS